MKQTKVFNKYVYYGTTRGIGLGIFIDNYCLDINFFKYYIQMEF